MNDIIINHLMYTDNTCIIDHSASALQMLLDIRAVIRIIIFYEKKTNLSVSIWSRIH